MIQDNAEERPSRAWFVVLLALLAYILSNIDRQLISILIVPIQRDLGLSDTEFGLIQGLAYGLFYAGVCIPIAGLSDRFNRVSIMAGGLAFWSIATAACGFAGSFWRLFIARAFVGIGESSLLPAVYSLIGDLFPRDKLGRAMGLFFLGPFLGSTCAFLFAGAAFHWLGESGIHNVLGLELATWQLTFVLAALPGLTLALIIALCVRDPRPTRPRSAAAQQPLLAALPLIFRQCPALMFNMIGFAVMVIPLYVSLAWAPAYLIRLEGISSAEAGVVLGGVSLFAGCAGALLGGFLSDSLVSRGRPAGPFEVGIVSAALLTVTMAGFLFIGAKGGAIILIASSIFLASLSMAPSTSVIQMVAPAEFRSRVSALFLVLNLAIQTVAVVGVGILNDYVFHGPGGIASSLPLFNGAAALASGLVLFAGRSALARALRAAQRH